MLSPEELRESPLFQSISYESYLAMYDCFRAVNRTFRPYEVMYDYSSGSVSADSDSVGIIERGTASLIRVDENGVATVLEELGPGGVFGKALAFAGSSQDVLEVVCRTSCEVVYTTPRSSSAVRMPAFTIAYSFRTCCASSRRRPRLSASGWTSSPAGP